MLINNNYTSIALRFFKKLLFRLRKKINCVLSKVIIAEVTLTSGRRWAVIFVVVSGQKNFMR